MVETLTLLFILELTLFGMVDYYKYRTVYTPVLFLSIPFAVVLLIAVFATPHAGFFPVSEYAIILWATGLVLFWLSGAFLTFSVVKNRICYPFAGMTSSRSITVTIRVVSWLFLAILLESCIQSYMQNGTFRSEAFSRDFAGHGMAAHALSLMRYNLAYLVSIKNDKRCQTFCIAVCTFVFLFLYNVKGTMIITAFVCLFVWLIVSRKSLDFKRILVFVFLGTFFFIASYALSLGHIRLNFIIFHFLTYLVAGVIGLSEHLRSGLPVDTDFALLLQPIKNIYCFLSGAEVTNRISDLWVFINQIHIQKSNVKTLFGEIYIYAGFFKGFFIVVLMGLLSYFFLLVTILKKNILYLILYLFILTSLMFGWFNYYFNDLFYYEVVVYVFAVTCIGSLLQWLSFIVEENAVKSPQAISR